MSIKNSAAKIRDRARPTFWRHGFLGATTAFTLLVGGTWYLPAVSIQSRTDQIDLTNREAWIAQATPISATSVQQTTLYLNNDRLYSYNLEVFQGTTINGLYIPAGSVIQGDYVPASGGLRYQARSVTVDGRAYPLEATSEVIEDVKDPRDTSAGSIAEDAGIGAAGGLAIGEILGDADILEVLGGAAAGAAVGNVTADRVVVVEPNEPIVLY